MADKPTHTAEQPRRADITTMFLPVSVPEMSEDHMLGFNILYVDIHLL